MAEKSESEIPCMNCGSSDCSGGELAAELDALLTGLVDTSTRETIGSLAMVTMWLLMLSGPVIRSRE